MFGGISCLFFLTAVVCVLPVTGVGFLPHSILRRSVHKAASIGSSKVMECDINYPGGQYAEHIISWKKQDVEVPIFIKMNTYPAHIDPSYTGRLRLISGATIRLDDIRSSDEGWYECSIMFINNEEAETNGTWIYLAVNTPPVLGPVSPSFMIQQEGETVDMYCEATGTPEPTVTWMKDGRELLPGNRVLISGNRIQVKELKRPDGGIYTCSFKNIAGVVSHVIKLIIKGNAYIMFPPKNTTTGEGSNAKLSCQTEAVPSNLTYHWLKNGIDVHRVSGLMTRAHIAPNGALVIESVRREDTGWFKCRPSNGIGEPPEASAYLNITYPPRVLSMPGQLYLPKGLMGRIDCPVDANPPMTQLTWNKDGQKIVTRANNHLSVNKRGTLIIKSVQALDEGEYTCSPMSALGAGPVSSPVQVIVKDPPYFVVRPKPVYQSELHQGVLLPCVAKGDPPPTVTWRKADGTFPSDTRTLQNGGNLTIANLVEADSGTYECAATNVVTSVITSTLLLIESTPPHAPYNITVETTQNTARVSWFPAYNDGSYQHYVLWYKVQDGNREGWQSIRITPNDATSITLYNLQPNTHYQIAIHSRNPTGEGLSSNPITAITKGLYNETTTSGKSSHHPTPTITGPKPGTPRNVTVRLDQEGLLISWLPPRDNSVPYTHFVINYRTVTETWLPLVNEIDRSRRFFKWKQMSHTADYQFQVLACYNKEYVACSEGSASVVFNTGDPMEGGMKLTEGVIGGIVGGLICLLLLIIIAAKALKIYKKRLQREKAARYGNVKYFGPNQVEANKKFPLNTSLYFWFCCLQ